MLQSSKHKKPLTNQANHSNFTQMLINYAKDNKSKNNKINTNRARGKQNKKSKKEATDIFIEECIKFKQPQQANNRLDVNKQQKISNQFPLQQSFGRIIVNKPQNNREKGSCKQINRSIANKSSNSNKMQNASFQQAIKKIFKDLDIFNRGRISQTNINKWIPQSALYFLGGVFQRIKLQRLSLTQYQFLTLCLPLMDKSNQQDIKTFVQQVLGQQSKLNVSIEFQQEQRINQNSPIIKRINFFSHSQKQNKLNQQKIFNTNKKVDWFASGLDNNTYHKDQLNAAQQSNKNNYIKQRAIRPNIDNSKEKIKQFNYSPFSTEKKKLQQITSYNKHIEVNSFTSNVTKRSPVKNVYNVIEKYSNLQKKELQNMIVNRTRQIKISQSNQYPKKTQNKRSEQPPSFTFLIDSSQQISANQIITFHPDKHANKQSRSNSTRLSPNILYNEQKFSKECNIQLSSRPKTSRIMYQNIDENDNKVSRSSSINNDKDTQKIDRLSSRLQEYIKFNKQTIQKNTKFIRQNSTSHR